MGPGKSKDQHHTFFVCMQKYDINDFCFNSGNMSETTYLQNYILPSSNYDCTLFLSSLGVAYQQLPPKLSFCPFYLWCSQTDKKHFFEYELYCRYIQTSLCLGCHFSCQSFVGYRSILQWDLSRTFPLEHIPYLLGEGTWLLQ